MFRPAALGERTKLPVSKDVPSRCAAHSLDIPSDHDIAIRLVPAQTIAQKPKGGGNRAVVAHVVAVMHVDEDPALGRHQTRKLAENLHAGGGGKDVSEDIPETRDDVKLAFEQVKFFGAHGLELSLSRALHRHAGLHQNELRDVSGLCDPAGSPAVARSDIEHGAAAGGISEITSRSMPSRYALRFSAMRANTGPIRSYAATGSNRVDKTRAGLPAAERGLELRGNSTAPHLRAMGGRRSARRSAGPRLSARSAPRRPASR